LRRIGKIAVHPAWNLKPVFSARSFCPENGVRKRFAAGVLLGGIRPLDGIPRTFLFAHWPSLTGAGGRGSGTSADGWLGSSGAGGLNYSAERKGSSMGVFLKRGLERGRFDGKAGVVVGWGRERIVLSGRRLRAMPKRGGEHFPPLGGPPKSPPPPLFFKGPNP